MLADRFGGDFDRALDEQPEALAEAAHVSHATIETLREHWWKTRNVNAALTLLSAFGLTYHQVSTLVEKLGNNVLAILQDDPYLIIREVRGMSFKKVDQVARKLGHYWPVSRRAAFLAPYSVFQEFTHISGMRDLSSPVPHPDSAQNPQRAGSSV